MVVSAGLARAGDINNDGYADIVIGAPGATAGTGICYVIYGTATPKNIALGKMRTTQGFLIVGANQGDHLGYVINTAGISAINVCVSECVSCVC